MADTRSLQSTKSTQESEASAGERHARETAEKAVLLLAELLKSFKRNLPPDVAVKLGDNPDVSIKVGNEQVFKGSINKPELDRLDPKDLDYLAFATGQSQGVKHIDLTRDVEILIGGKKVFEVKSGEVTLNLLGPQQTQKLVVELNSIADLSKTAEGRQAEYLELAKQGAASEGVDFKPNFALLKSEVVSQGLNGERGQQLESWVSKSAVAHAISPTDYREIVSAGVVVEAAREIGHPQESIDKYLAQSEEYYESHLPIKEAQVTPEQDRQAQVIEAARNIVNQMGSRDGSGEREFCGAHYTISQYGDELKILDSDGHNVAAIGGVGDRHDYAVSPELEDSLLVASAELDVLMKDRELELEQESELELGD
jgi:hypothetical protein